MTESQDLSQVEGRSDWTTLWVIDADGWLPIRRSPVPLPELIFDPDPETGGEGVEDAYGDSMPGMTLEQWDQWATHLINRNR